MKHKSRVLDEWCAKVGRDPAEVERSVGIDRNRISGDLTEAAEQYHAAGFTQFTFGFTGPVFDLSVLEPWLAWRDHKNA